MNSTVMNSGCKPADLPRHESPFGTLAPEGTGCNNNIDSVSTSCNCHNFIGNGCANSISSFPNGCSFYNTIGNGCNNQISGYAQHSGIFSGDTNAINGNPDVVAGDPTFNFIGLGSHNVIAGSIIASCPASFSAIVSGCNNCIDTGTIPGSDNIGSFIAAGSSNSIFGGACYSSIGSGQGNTVAAGACYSWIAGGQGNSVSGCCSAILGGNGNSDGGFNNVVIAGSGITAISSDTLHANGLWANNLPYNPFAPLPPGTIFAMPSTVFPLWALPTTGVLFIA